MGLGEKNSISVTSEAIHEENNSTKHTKSKTEEFTWSEISKHSKRDSRWIVINDCIYDVTRWVYKHPGGNPVISHYAGQDATEAFHAFHNDLSFVKKYLGALQIGVVKQENNSEVSCHDSQTVDRIKRQRVREDFEILRQKAQNMGLFKTSSIFFMLHLGHILLFEALAYWNMKYFGTNWLSYFVSVLFYTIVQSQAGWLQHDFGHLSVFSSSRLNHFFHQLVMGVTKGASCDWWNHMHYQHHAKPNVVDKDPDVRIQPLFVVGEKMPLEVAQNKKFFLPYNFQHRYFFVVGPPLLFPFYFQYMTFRHAVTRQRYQDLFWMSIFFAKLIYLYSPMLGVGGALAYYFIVRILESHWFTWVSQSNHIPMEIERDRDEPWLALQIHATCDIEQSFFNDWFTGHLNFQIEHHLFPTMPRHHYHSVQPMVQELCERHGIPYQVKPLWTAFKDIVKSLKHSGEIWYAAYHAYHLD